MDVFVEPEISQNIYMSKLFDIKTYFCHTLTYFFDNKIPQVLAVLGSFSDLHQS